MKQNNTKEKIFEISINLFSQYGYNAVSIRQIARNVGIKESSIYNHYKNKEAILNSILNHFSTTLDVKLPHDEMIKIMEKDPEEVYHCGAELFKKQLKDRQLLKILRIILIEMFQNQNIREYVLEAILKEPILFWTNQLSIMLNKQLIKPEINPEQVAKSYYSYIIYLIFDLMLKHPDLSEDVIEQSIDTLFNKIEEHAYFLLDNIKV